MGGKYYKLTLARLGKQESWAGWKIAGKSQDTPKQVMESFESYHSSKNQVVGSLRKMMDMYEVSEYRGNVFVSKIKFGIKDMLGRPTFSVKGFAFQVSENPDIYTSPELLLSFTYSDFDFSLKKLYDENRVLKNEYVSGSSVVTILDDACIRNRHLDFNEIKAKWFSEDSKYESFVRSIYWAGNNNQVVLHIKVPDDFNEYFEIMYLIYCILPFGIRRSFGFRSANLRGLSGAKIVFASDAISGKYFDIASGSNNIFVDSNILNNSKKYSFIQYVIENKNEELKDYFELLQESLDKMGQSKSTDLNTIEMAHNMLSEEDEEEELIDADVLKKFQEYISLDYSNDLVDENIVKYLRIIIEKNIYLNDTLFSKLENRLSVTKYQPLIDMGYSYKASQILKEYSDDPEKVFASLFEYEEQTNDFEKLIIRLLSFPDGAAFLDDYYASFYFRKKVDNSESLSEFYQKTKELPERACVSRAIRSKAIEHSDSLVKKMLEEHIDFDLEEYKECLLGLGLSKESVQQIVEEMKRRYWASYSFMKFSFSRIEDYLNYLPYYNWQFSLIEHVYKDVVQRLSEQDAKTIRIFSNLISGRILKEIRLTADEEKYITKSFQKYCLDYFPDKSTHLDFWFEVAHLDKFNYIEFIFRNRITVFTDPKCFAEEIVNSELYLNKDKDLSCGVKYSIFCTNLLTYVYSHGEYAEIGRVLSRIKDQESKSREIYSSSKGKQHSTKDEKIVTKEREHDSKGKERFSKGNERVSKEGEEPEKKNFFSRLGGIRKNKK